MEFIGFLPHFGNLLWTIVAFIVALSIIVFVHEYGHYIVGRWSGIRAETFSIGFGPRIWSRMDRRGTRWQIAAIPLGGYVKFLGDANAASAGADETAMARLSPEERRQTMHGAPLWARAATVAAGPVFNFILSILVFAALFMIEGRETDQPQVNEVVALPDGPGGLLPGDVILAIAGMPTTDFDALQKVVDSAPPEEQRQYRVLRDGAELEITGPVPFPARAERVLAGSAAFDAGIKSGDVILSADGAPIADFNGLRKAVEAAAGKPMTLRVWRNGEELDLQFAPRVTDTPNPDGTFTTGYKIGVLGSLAFTPVTERLPPHVAVGEGAVRTWGVAKSSLSAMWHIVTGAISTCNLRGPLTIAETSGAAATEGFSDFFWFIAGLSTAVGLLNLFPIPMLDGGHLVFHAWEAIARRPPSDKALNVLMTIGLALVLALMVFGLTNDLRCP